MASSRIFRASAVFPLVSVLAVYGNVYPNTNAGESLCAAIVRLASGAVVQLYADAFRGAEATRIEVVGTDGTVRWSADRHEITIQRRSRCEHRVEQVPVDDTGLEEAEMRHFLACVLTGRTVRYTTIVMNPAKIAFFMEFISDHALTIRLLVNWDFIV